MNVEIRKSSVEEFFAYPEVPGLLAAYAAECANTGLPPPSPSRKLYELLENAGMLTCITAHIEGRVIGFATLLVCENAHYSVPIGSTESIFVAKAHRAGGAGIKLLGEIEMRAEELGAYGLYVSAPVGGALSSVMPSKGFRYTNCVFFKGFR